MHMDKNSKNEEAKAPTMDLKSVMAQLNSQEVENKMLSSKDKHARSVARLVLVQALYQMEISGIGAEAVIREFTDFRLGGDAGLEGDGIVLAQADEVFFGEGVREIVNSQSTIDYIITERLASNWRIERLDATLRAILRCGAWELKFRNDIGHEVVINEYVEIAKAFFGDTESKFVNAALDGIAIDVRQTK